MKAILTLTFILLMGTAAQAKDDKGEVKVSAVTMDITNSNTVIFEPPSRFGSGDRKMWFDSPTLGSENGIQSLPWGSIPFNGVAPIKHHQVARLYKYKNSKVLKALNFSTRKNAAKLA